ncbi:hypothetical protein J3R82DRAFT_1929 [Butyriboletus roseoflavus]|nr:hypothetical protein J3R82DRAFT_1929 [Butyriboletus roseoflavus]
MRQGIARREGQRAADVEREGREVDERTRTTNDEPEGRAETSTDETAATTTVNASMGANARTSHSASLAGERDGQVTTDDAGADNNEDETTSTPDAPQSMPLEGECTGQSSGSSTGLTTREMTRPTKTGASARSTSHDHHQPDKSDESRPSENPPDTTGDDERHPDESTEPPDKPEGARWRSGEPRAGTVESKMPGELRCAEAMGEISDETRQPSKPTEPPDEVEDAHTQTDEPCDESKDRASIQVEPGGAQIEGGKSVADEVDQRNEGTSGEAEEDSPEVPTPRSNPPSPLPHESEMPPHTDSTRADRRHSANAHGEGKTREQHGGTAPLHGWVVRRSGGRESGHRRHERDR